MWETLLSEVSEQSLFICIPANCPPAETCWHHIQTNKSEVLFLHFTVLHNARMCTALRFLNSTRVRLLLHQFSCLLACGSVLGKILMRHNSQSLIDSFLSVFFSPFPPARFGLGCSEQFI